ncbi:MAG: hypothetical protein BYD32DRAFT_172864 [Podila humilis]|nr:MAG: hypothetical protein BYD32DRAFT_172864 [Podila humilis]
MVQLSFSILTVSSLAFVIAAPFLGQTSLSQSRTPLGDPLDDCIDFGGKTFKENEPFRLLNLRREPLAENYAFFPNILILGKRNDPAFSPLDFCVVTGSDQDCLTAVESGCIRRDVNYRFLFHVPNYKFYLVELNGQVYFSPIYETGSDFLLLSHGGNTTQIVSVVEERQAGVLRGTPGKPISIGPSSGGDDELFFMEQTDCIEFGLDTFLENHPFRLVNSANDPLAENYDLFPNVLFLGNRNDPAFNPIDICAVTGPDQDCSDSIKSGCLRRDVKYRFLFHILQYKFYMSQVYGEVWFAGSYDMGTDFKFISHDGEAARIITVMENGHEGVFQGTPGELISLVPSTGGTNELFFMENPACINFGRKTFREYHPFRLINSHNDSLSENYALYPNVVFLGKQNDPAFHPLDICAVTGPDQECSSSVRTGCIRHDVKYRLMSHYLGLKFYMAQVYGDIYFSNSYGPATEFKFISHEGEATRVVAVMEDGNEGVFQGTPGELIKLVPSLGGDNELFYMESVPGQ